MNTGEILIYQNLEGNIKIDVRLEEETVWLTQAQIALLFGKGRFNRSIICDTKNNKFYFIPNGLCDILQTYRAKPLKI